MVEIRAPAVDEALRQPIIPLFNGGGGEVGLDELLSAAIGVRHQHGAIGEGRANPEGSGGAASGDRAVGLAARGRVAESSVGSSEDGKAQSRDAGGGHGAEETHFGRDSREGKCVCGGFSVVVWWKMGIWVGRMAVMI